MVAVFVDRSFVFAAADEVSPGHPVSIGLGVRATAGPQAEDFAGSHSGQIGAHDERGSAQVPPEGWDF